MIYHSSSYLGLLIFLGYAISAAVPASRYLSLFFTNYFGIIRQSLLFSTCYIQTAYFFLPRLCFTPQFNFSRAQIFKYWMNRRIRKQFTGLSYVVFHKATVQNLMFNYLSVSRPQLNVGILFRFVCIQTLDSCLYRFFLAIAQIYLVPFLVFQFSSLLVFQFSSFKEF